MARIIPLEIKVIRNQNQVGGKAYQLAYLKDNGFNIPEGFVIPTDEFESFHSETGIENLIETSSTDDNITKKIQKIFKNNEIDASLKDEIDSAAANFSAEKFAVRSSATCEDQTNASFAGIFKTYLNISKIDIPKYVKKVWESGFSEISLNYLKNKNLTITDIKIAVLVIQMVESAKAGVIFTKDIISGKKNTFTIEAVTGYGDKVVDGSGDIEHLQINSKTFEILEQNGPKIMNSSEITTLVQNSLKIERLYKNSQDIEWAFDTNGKLFILQSRPITT